MNASLTPTSGGQYWRTLLAREARVFQPRAAVFRLLGRPASGGEVSFSRPLPPAGFTYARFDVTDIPTSTAPPSPRPAEPTGPPTAANDRSSARSTGSARSSSARSTGSARSSSARSTGSARSSSARSTGSARSALNSALNSALSAGGDRPTDTQAAADSDGTSASEPVSDASVSASGAELVSDPRRALEPLHPASFAGVSSTEMLQASPDSPRGSAPAEAENAQPADSQDESTRDRNQPDDRPGVPEEPVGSNVGLSVPGLTRRRVEFATTPPSPLPDDGVDAGPEKTGETAPQIHQERPSSPSKEPATARSADEPAGAAPPARSPDASTSTDSAKAGLQPSRPASVPLPPRQRPEPREPEADHAPASTDPPRAPAPVHVVRTSARRMTPTVPWSFWKSSVLRSTHLRILR